VAPAAPAAAAAPDGPLKCPNCDGDVPVNFKFCGTCGHNMTEVQAAAAAAAPEAAPAAAPVAAAPSPAPSADTRGNLVLIRPDGTEGESYPLGSGATVVGRDSSGPFASDAYLSPQHAEFSFDGDTVVVSDKSSLNGIYRKIAPEQPVPLRDGTIFRVGQEILRFEDLPANEPGPDGSDKMGSPNPGFLGRIRLVVGRDGYGSSYCVPPAGMHLGRDRGDIIFPDDGYVSGLHCRIHGEPGSISLTDVGSSNGTFIRLEEPTPLPTGSLLLMGMQLFRVEY